MAGNPFFVMLSLGTIFALVILTGCMTEPAPVPSETFVPVTTIVTTPLPTAVPTTVDTHNTSEAERQRLELLTHLNQQIDKSGRYYYVPDYNEYDDVGEGKGKGG